MKQFGILGDLTPFEPANPALDIPDGDPLESKKVTNQSMNAWYGELANAITKSGQTLTPLNGTSPNPSQLWNAISSARFDWVKSGIPAPLTTTGQVFTSNLNFVAPCDGIAIITSTLNVAAQTTGVYKNEISVNSALIGGTGSYVTCVALIKQVCLKGQSYSFQQTITVETGGSTYIDRYLSYLFLAGA